MNETRKYESPRLTVVGSVEALTLGHSTGTHLDAAFDSGTGKGQLTFS